MRARTQEEMIQHLLDNSYHKEETDCLIWTGCTAGQMNYGVTSWQGKQVYIHRMVYQFYNSNTPIDIIRHSCDTPRCWQPYHLLNGTVQDNTDDKIARGRHIFGSSNYNSRFTEQDIIDIRASNLNLYELAHKYDVTPSTIFYIRARKTWKHVA